MIVRHTDADIKTKTEIKCAFNSDNSIKNNSNVILSYVFFFFLSFFCRHFSIHSEEKSGKIQGK